MKRFKQMLCVLLVIIGTLFAYNIPEATYSAIVFHWLNSLICYAMFLIIYFNPPKENK